jgi:hypothetical protein
MRDSDKPLPLTAYSLLLSTCSNESVEEPVAGRRADSTRLALDARCREGEREEEAEEDENRCRACVTCARTRSEDGVAAAPPRSSRSRALPLSFLLVTVSAGDPCRTLWYAGAERGRRT